MNPPYDVIVVGAGPAGCTAAKLLAEDGRRVLLVEKFSMPRYKSCSGVLIQKSLDLVERYFGERVPEAARCAPEENRGMVFTNDRGATVRDKTSNVKDHQLVLGVAVRSQSRTDRFYEHFLSFLRERHGLRLLRRARRCGAF